MTTWVAFAAGALSFLSPCTLPLLPLYISYITGLNVQQIKEDSSLSVRRNILLHSIVFLLGVSAVYLTLGLGVSYLGNLFSSVLTGPVSVLLQRLAGLLIILMGLTTVGYLKIPLLLGDRRKLKTTKGVSFLSTFLIGLGFAAGWTPCIGPIFFIDPAAGECDGVATGAVSADVRAWLFGAIPIGKLFSSEGSNPF